MNFDQEVKTFEDGKGIPDDVLHLVIQAIEHWLPTRGRMLEIGPGAGQFAQAFINIGWIYTGLETSEGMTKSTNERLGESLVQHYHGQMPWPVEAQSCQAVFGSRVFHLIDPKKLAAELIRVLNTGGGVFSFRIRKKGLPGRQELKSRLFDLLSEAGYHPVRKGHHREVLKAELTRAGWQTQEILVGQWKKSESLLDLVNSWRNKNGLQGVNLPVKEHEKIIDQLTKELTDLKDNARVHSVDYEGILTYSNPNTSP